LAKFDSDALGCFRISFSNNGSMLAAACTSSDTSTVIKIFDVETEFKLIYTYRGHENIIHQLAWSKNDKYLASVSSDFMARV